MSRLVDPTICPDCRALLDSAGRCTGCGLHLRGPLATELWSTMQSADGLIERLRGSVVDVLDPAPAHQAASPATPGPELPTHPARPAATQPAPRRVPSLSVPVVLLALGAICLLVAAAVFVAVSWSDLGLAARTCILLACTALLAGIAVVLTRKDLRLGAETFWLVVAGMLVVDLLGAQSSGLLGLDALGWRGTSALVGGTLFVLGTGVALWARNQPVTALFGMQAVAVAGTLVTVSTNGWSARHEVLGTTVALAVCAALFLALRRLLPGTAWSLAALSALSWVVLLGHGMNRSTDGFDWSDYATSGRVLPLVLAMGIAACVAEVPGLPRAARSVAAAGALVAFAFAVVGPGGNQIQTTLMLSTLLALAGLLAWFGPRVWDHAAAVLAGPGSLVGGATVALGVWSVPGRLPASGDHPLGLPVPQAYGAHPWLVLVIALGTAVALWGLRRLAPPLPTPGSPTHLAAVLTAGLAGLALLGAVLGARPALWVATALAVVVVLLLAATTALVARDGLVITIGTVGTGYVALLALRLALPSWLLSAVVASVLMALAGATYARMRATWRVAGAAHLLLALLMGAWAVSRWAALADLGVGLGSTQTVQAVALATYAAAVIVAAGWISRDPISRLTAELSGVVLGLVALPIDLDSTTVAMVLTILGTAVCAASVLHRDRAPLGWVGAAVLGVATLIRIDDQVSLPELYTLPAALLLLGCGVWLLRRDPHVGSVRALGSGLTLALLPSLLLALDEPVTVRGAVIAAAGLVVLAIGVQQRLAAPFLAGALTTGLLALRHLWPVAEALPRWISLGAVGLVLLVVGLTWEARRRNVQHAGRYLTALR